MTARLAELSARCEDLEREREERDGRARKQVCLSELVTKTFPHLFLSRWIN